MPTHDAPFFKVLARNDTGESGGHQGGLVIPRAIASYFPHLEPSMGPTTDRAINISLSDGDEFVGQAVSRFQMQTWGKTRSPEYRLTRNIVPLLRRANARAGDLLQFERETGELERYRLTLIRGEADQHERISHALGSQRAGAMRNRSPASGADLHRALRSIHEQITRPFESFEQDATPGLTTSQRLLRSEAFQSAVRLGYDYRCALCGGGFRTPEDRAEVEAAHIVPRRLKGTNDARNGLALCRSHHWAFDQHLWTIDDDRRVVIPRSIRSIRENAPLVSSHDRRLKPPERDFLQFAPAQDALQWHRETTKQRRGT